MKEHITIWRKLKTAAFEDLNIDDDDVLVECDLLEKSDAWAKTLSGGQMRKLQLAISFAGGSKVCCIDEASSGLVNKFSSAPSEGVNLANDDTGPFITPENMGNHPKRSRSSDCYHHHPFLGKLSEYS